MRVSGPGRVEDKVIGADVKELSCQDIRQDFFSIDIEITRNYDRSSSSESDRNQELKLQRKMRITQEPEMVVTRSGSEENSLMT